jgi:hypothetical protein
MRLTVAALLVAAPLLASTAAVAQPMGPDDIKWINQCAKDNEGGASADVVQKYCTCMDLKMGNNERRSITQWEKTHPTEREACDKEAGWK